ncbi:hypothetical protein [Prescottella agglutinans]|uniref:Uncharacterized protein n=1 Tax=Prescottella agglutinans TaxID=1644129 RepID=A0ABT6MJZ0_9NOCA|nr:hypothetical protein [Prescottella agglutinans]MDH6284530.1 hypothetical protein [Prescottella agglutinans]
MAARSTFRGIAADMRWNPWVREDRADEWERALQVMDQWHRAEPGHRQLTEAEIEARLEQSDEEIRAERDAMEQRFERERAHYDADRAHARLQLIEARSLLHRERKGLTGTRDGVLFPAMPTEQRAERLAEQEHNVDELAGRVATLETAVGDPETVVDEYGRRPRDRREIALSLYTLRRTTRVYELREQLPDLRADLEAAEDKSQRAERRQALADATRELETLLAIPPQAVDDMCSECATPMADHGWVSPQTAGPCPAWPGWAAKVRDVRAIFERASQRAQPAAEVAPAPQPLAVIASGLPIADVIAQLEKLQQTYPDAEVRRGRAGRLELWPRKHGTDT